MIGLPDQKPDIDYPCPWEYRVIGADEGRMKAAVADVLGKEDYTLRKGKRSPAGRWVSLSLTLEVLNETHRYEVHRVLREHPDIRMVL